MGRRRKEQEIQKRREKGVDKGEVRGIMGKLLEKRCHLQEEVHPSQKNKKDRQKESRSFFMCEGRLDNRRESDNI